MKSLVLPLPLLVALSSGMPTLALAASAPQESSREAVRAYSGLVSLEVHGALLEVLAAENEFTELVNPLDENGELIGQAERDWRLNDPESPLKQYLDRHRERFDTHGLEMDIAGLRDCILYDAAHRVAAKLVTEHPDFDPDALLAAFTTEFVNGSPIWTSELAEEFQRRAWAEHELAALGNGRALARLTWGVLQQEQWWSVEGRDRGQLILGLFGRGFESRLVAQVVDLALANPLRASLRPSMDGRGVCAPHLPVAEDVGYDRRHEQALMNDLELVTHLSSIQDPTGAFDLELVDIDLLPGGSVHVTPNQLGHLRYWVPRRLKLVRDELYEGEYREQVMQAMRRSTSLDERYLYWFDLASTSSFASLRAQMLEEFQALMDGEAAFPGTERLRELEARASMFELSGDERAELQALRTKADREQDQFLRTLTRSLVVSGARGNIDFLVATLRDDLTEVLAPLGQAGVPGETRLDSLLDDAWYRLATTDSLELNRVLEQGLAGAEAGGIELPMVGRVNLIWAAAQDGSLAARLNLDRVLESGSARERAVAMLNPQWADDATYSHAMQDLIEDAWSSEVDFYSRMRIEAYFSSSMASRDVTPASKQVLLRSLRDERWASTDTSCYWSQAWEDTELFSERIALVRRYLTEDEIAQLTAEGLLPEGLF